jgi:cystinosin
VGQIIYYKKDAHQPNQFHVLLTILLWTIALYNVVLSILKYLPWILISEDDGTYSTVDYLGYAKMIITLVKYIPQAYRNYVRKATVGWSILNVLLDGTGGTLSLMQQFLDCYRLDTWTLITSNFPKFLLSLLSLFFSIVFCVQHYILYAANNRAILNKVKLEQESEKQNQEQGLLTHEFGHLAGDAVEDDSYIQ